MGLIRAIITLIILAIIVVFGYWVYGTYVNTDTPYWSQINTRMPDSLRRYSCDQIKKRNTGTAVASCEGY
jgi:hypothetical protein